jgi:predicted murein hydrolase (TIGR00659 family)
VISATKTVGELAGHPAVVTALTVAIFVAAQKAQRRWPNIPLFNPTLVAVVSVIAYIECSGISYQSYILNTQVLSFMLAPTVVLLAVPLYRRLALIRSSWKIIACSLIIGLPTGIMSAVGLALVWGAKDDTLYSLVPKAVTTGIAVGVSERIGGIPALTAAFVIITGIFGAAFGPVLLRLMNVRDERAFGLAMGIGAHGIGTARAFQISDKTGAFSSLAMALNGIATAIIIPGAVAVFQLSLADGTAREQSTSDAHAMLASSNIGASTTLAFGHGRVLLILAVGFIILIVLAGLMIRGRFRGAATSPEHADATE